MNHFKTAAVAAFVGIFTFSSPTHIAYAGSGAEAFVGALLGGALGSAVTNEYFNRWYDDNRRYYYEPAP